MARVRNPVPTLDSLFFSAPEQKVIRFLLSEPTSTFSIRVIASKLKGVRGIGGAEGLEKILKSLETIGLVAFVDNRRGVRLQDDSPTVQLLKRFVAVCDLENLKSLLQPISHRGILFGSRANGTYRSDSDYDLFVVTERAEEVRRIAASHPLGNPVEVVTWTQEAYDDIEAQDPALLNKLAQGIVIWSGGW